MLFVNKNPQRKYNILYWFFYAISTFSCFQQLKLKLIVVIMYVLIYIYGGIL